MATQAASKPTPIQCTGGAIPYRNEKGEISMKKVKVKRYISGKKPDFAPSSGESTEYEEVEYTQPVINQKVSEYHQSRNEYYSDSDQEYHKQTSKMDKNYEKKKAEVMERLARHKQLHKENEVNEDIDVIKKHKTVKKPVKQSKELPDDISYSSGSEDSESDADEHEIEKRRLALRQKLLDKIRRAKEKENEKQLQQKLAKSSLKEGKGEISEQDSDEESEEEEDDYDDIFNKHQRLKPVFVPKKDRITIKEREDDEEKQRLAEIKAKRAAEERRKETLKMVEEEARHEHDKAVMFGNKINPSDSHIFNNLGTVAGSINKVDNHATVTAKLEDIDTDDEFENTEKAFESWKLRETTRLKSDKEDKDKLGREKAEYDKLHRMTEEERVEYLRQNPKIVTNKAQKGKYRFLQKYYHRGAFFLDEEEDVFKRDVTLPTLEDHFDKTIMPKIMQVKNFGKAGRTKYTHLVDQDTTAFDSPWTTHNPQSLKFVNNHAAGMKQVFNKPTRKK